MARPSTTRVRPGALDFTEYGEPSAGEYEVYTFGADGTYETDDRVTVSS